LTGRSRTSVPTGHSDMGSSISSIRDHRTFEFDCSVTGCYSCTSNFQEAFIETNDNRALYRIWWFDASCCTFSKYWRVESCGDDGSNNKLSVVGPRFSLLDEIKIASNCSCALRNDNDYWRINAHCDKTFSGRISKP